MGKEMRERKDLSVDLLWVWSMAQQYDNTPYTISLILNNPP